MLNATLISAGGEHREAVRPRCARSRLLPMRSASAERDLSRTFLGFARSNKCGHCGIAPRRPILRRWRCNLFEPVDPSYALEDASRKVRRSHLAAFTRPTTRGAKRERDVRITEDLPRTAT